MTFDKFTIKAQEAIQRTITSLTGRSTDHRTGASVEGHNIESHRCGQLYLSETWH